jgi:2-polyprenyl-6-methoxyphenol hydroxylase-like FAD-dependent oxidoreductase
MVARGHRDLTGPPDVLVVGAGPTGLTTALQAHDHGARVRVVERRTELFRPSRAMVMHPRALESLRPLGVTDDLLDRADRAPSAQLHLGRRVVSASLAEVAMPDTAFPHLTLLRQTAVEEVLSKALRERGVEVERGVDLVASTSEHDLARVVLRSADGAEQLRCRFVVGCDGPASTVRSLSGIGWRGRPYREEVVLADVELDGDLAPGALHVGAGRAGLVFVFAQGEAATWRVLATRPSRGSEAAFGQPGGAVPREEVQQLLDDAGLPVTVGAMAWSAQVRLQHRVAGSFRRGAFFLAGDAAHTHSPAAAQGMNTGMLDAVNLGWKLGFAANGDRGACAALLDSYDEERRPVARKVVALTHLVFLAEASSSPLPAFLRGTLVPLAAPALPLLLAQQSVMTGVVRLLSQRWVRYRDSVLSVSVGSVRRGPRPGDRLPDEVVVHEGREVRLHDLTAGPGVHVLVERDTARLADLVGPWVSVHRVSGWSVAGLVAVRPDGHVGFRSERSDDARLVSWLDLVGARSRQEASR